MTTKVGVKNKATELEFLQYYRRTAARWFSEGGTDEDYWIMEQFKEDTGKSLPAGYDDEEEAE